MVEIYLNGKPRHLKYDWPALCALERKSGLGLLQLMEEMGKTFKFSYIGLLLWSGLLHEDEKLTLEEVERWISPDQLVGISKKLHEAFGQAAENLKGVFDGLESKSKLIN